MTLSLQHQLRQQLVETSCRLVETGLNRGTSGNCSVRFDDGFLITPSAVPAEELTPDHMVLMDGQGKVLSEGKPSSEWRFHCDIFRQRKDAQAIVHVHSVYATSLACMNQDIPAFHYMMAVAGGDSIRCAPYALFGTQQLSDNVLQALQHRKACLMANHGMIALGTSLAHALSITTEVELLSQQYCQVLQLGKPVVLSDEQMADVQKKFKGYGQWNKK